MALFALGTIKTNIRNSSFVTACFVLGYLNDFLVLRAILLMLRERIFSPRKAAIIVVLLIGNIAIIYLGYGLILALVTFCCLFIDGLLFKFK